MIRFILESLGDPFFYLGIAAVLGALFVPFLTLRRRKLFFGVVCELKLLGSEGNYSEHVRGTGEAARSHDDAERMLFVIDLHNAVGGLADGLAGGVAIAPAQYRQEISLGFGEDARVLEAGVMESPHGIAAKIRIDGSREDRLVLEAIPLNRGDSIRLKAVVKNPKAEPDPLWVGGGVRYVVEVEGCITGIKKIQRKWDSQKLLIYAFLAGTMGVILDYSVAGWVRGLLTGDRTWLLAPPALLLGIQVTFIGIAAILLILAFLKDKRSREIAGQLSSSYPIVERKPRMGWP